MKVDLLIKTGVQNSCTPIFTCQRVQKPAVKNISGHTVVSKLV